MADERFLQLEEVIFHGRAEPYIGLHIIEKSLIKGYNFTTIFYI